MTMFSKWSLFCVGKKMRHKHKYCIFPTRSKTACKPWVVLDASYTNKQTPSCFMYTPEFHSYHTAILLPGLDFVTLGNEHIFMMRWHQTRASSRRDRSITSLAQEYKRMIKNTYDLHGLGWGLVNNSGIIFYFAHEGRDKVRCVLVGNKDVSQKRDAN